jgi:hypothetical protein
VRQKNVIGQLFSQILKAKAPVLAKKCSFVGILILFHHSKKSLIMKKLLVILAFAVTFAACKKDNSPVIPPSHYSPPVWQDFTVNFKYVKNCSMQPVATGTEFLTDTLFKTDSAGNCVLRYRTTVDILSGHKTMFFTIEGMRRGFGVDNWTTNESLLFVQNDSLTVGVKFFYNAKTAAQLKDSLSIGYDDLIVPLPRLTHDSSFNMLIIGRNRIYRKGSDGKYTPPRTLQLAVKGKYIYEYFMPTLASPAAGPCGRDSLVIQ